ncbi:MAG TPA: hypothetical protein VKT78_11755, partial [Fimbriimonadaceae bacterium]|nr:hypothetical protein [Fimbriimonadaceae bacterium]
AMTATDNREKVLPIVTRYGSTAPSGHTVGLISDPWFWSPTLYRNITMGPMYPLEVRMRLMRDTGHPKVVRYLPNDGSKPEPYDPRLVTETKPDFIAYSDFETIYVERVSKMARVPDDFGADVERYKAFRSALESNYELVAQFGPSGNDMVEDMRYVLPAVYVWKRKL